MRDAHPAGDGKDDGGDMTKKDSQSLLLLCYDCLACFACFALLTQEQSRDDDDEHRTTNNVILVQDAVSPLVLRNLGAIGCWVVFRGVEAPL